MRHIFEDEINLNLREDNTLKSMQATSLPQKFQTADWIWIL